nr:protein FAR1-RELATED SEQUENCE 5-like [Coffea arabica]
MDCSKLTENQTPELGMEFNSEEDAYKFYNKYAFKMGFSVRKNYLNKNKDGVTMSRRYSCCKEGVKRKYEGDVMPKRTRAPTKTGCGVKMVIVLFRETMKYHVHDLVLEHNHELHITQCSHMMPSQRKVSETQGFQTEISEDAGFSLKQSHEFMGKDAGGMGNVGYTREDLKRYLRTRRERSLKYREAEMLIDYNFFGDVVTFDTTYKTNKEYRPLGVFVSFNQYRQIVIVGAVLMYDETIDSFKWVFGTFIEAMCGKRLSTILTDQDHAMATALSVVMPEIFHAMVILRQKDAAMIVEFVVMRYDEGLERIVVFNRNDLSVSELDLTSVSFEEYMFMGCRSSTDSVSTHSMSQTMNGPPNAVAPNIDESETEEHVTISTHCDVDAYHVFAPSPQGRNNIQGLQLRVDVASPENEVDE